MIYDMISPQVSDADAKTQIKQLRSWLFQLNEALKMQFSNIDLENFTDDSISLALSDLSQKVAECEKRLNELEAATVNAEWQPLSCVNLHAWTAGLPPMIINRGGAVSIEGGVRLASSLSARGTLNVFTLPAALTPRRRQVLALFSDNGLFRLDIGISGYTTIKNLTGSTFPTSTYLSLACSYSL